MGNPNDTPAAWAMIPSKDLSNLQTRSDFDLVVEDIQAMTIEQLNELSQEIRKARKRLKYDDRVSPRGKSGDTAVILEANTADYEKYKEKGYRVGDAISPSDLPVEPYKVIFPPPTRAEKAELASTIMSYIPRLDEEQIEGIVGVNDPKQSNPRTIKRSLS